jgi:hypothetical protein
MSCGWRITVPRFVTLLGIDADRALTLETDHDLVSRLCYRLFVDEVVVWFREGTLLPLKQDDL